MLILNLAFLKIKHQHFKNATLTNLKKGTENLSKELTMNESDALAKIVQSKASANRVAKSLSSSQLKSAISNLQSALKVTEPRETASDKPPISRS
jgi:hypothetical protein